jgi:hypothetical protein
VSVFNDKAGLARTGAEEVLVELAELFPEFSVADLATKRVPQEKADGCLHTFSGKIGTPQNAKMILRRSNRQRQGTAIPGNPR